MPKKAGTDEKLKAKVKQQLKQKAKVGAADDTLNEGDFNGIEETMPAAAPQSQRWRFLIRQAKTEDISMFFRQLAILIESGYPILRALNLLSSKTTNRHLANEVERIALKVEKGSSLAKAMATVPEYFSPMIVSMVEAGETGGQLVEVLNNIAEDFDTSEQLSDKIKTALSYPILTLVVAALVFLLILLVVVPTFNEVYVRHNMDLPASTAILVWWSMFLTDYWWLWIPGIAFIVWAARRRFGANLEMFDGMILKTPVLGEIITLGSMARFCSSLQVLLANGVPILQSLNLAKGSVGNSVLKDLIQDMHDNVEAGKSLAQPLARAGFLPSIMVDMMFVGEESGKLPFVLGQIVASLRLQLDRVINRLSITLGPVMTLIVGAFVLLITLSLFIPYFGFLSALSEIPIGR